MLPNTITVAYKDRHKYFNLVEGKYEIKQSCKDLNLHPFLFPDAFVPHLEPKERYSIWVGGNGSAKSTTKARSFIMRALRKKHFRLLFLRHNHSDNRSTTFLMLKGVVEKEGLTDQFHILESPMVIVCKETGNMLISGGLDQTGKFSGLEDFTDIWFEEPITRSDGKIKMITHEQFEDLDSRLRMPNAKLTMHVTLNPISKEFFVFKGIFDPKLEQNPEKRLYSWDKINYCHTTYLDNPFLPQEAIDVILNFKGIRAEYGKKGEWATEKTGQEWLDEFDRDRHVRSIGYIKDLPIHSGFDFNLLPYQTNVLLQILRKHSGILQIRVFKEYCMKPPLNTPENACKALKADYLEPIGFNSITVYGDASARHGYDGYRGIFEEYEAYTHEDSDQIMRSNGYVNTRRDMTNEILSGNIDDIEFVIDEECYNTILDLETLQTAPAGFNPEKDKNGVEQKGHCYSALSYILAKLFPHLLKENKGR